MFSMKPRYHGGNALELGGRWFGELSKVLAAALKDMKLTNATGGWLKRPEGPRGRISTTISERPISGFLTSLFARLSLWPVLPMRLPIRRRFPCATKPRYPGKYVQGTHLNVPPKKQRMDARK
jgi:hypothetical protein